MSVFEEEVKKLALPQTPWELEGCSWRWPRSSCMHGVMRDDSLVAGLEARDPCKGTTEVLLSSHATLSRKSWVRKKTDSSPVVLFNFLFERLREKDIRSWG